MHDAFMSVWTKISAEWSSILLNKELKLFWEKEKGVSDLASEYILFLMPPVFCAESTCCSLWFMFSTYAHLEGWEGP